ncbi:MAG: DUF1266 domain-containing protein [Bacteroidales bacterium]
MKMVIFKKSVVMLLLGVLVFTSCGGAKKGGDGKEPKEAAKAPESKTIQDDELKSFMLGGIYFVHGFGGKAKFDGMITQNGKSPKDVHEAAKFYLIFPFEQGQAGVKEMLSGMWEINNKEELLSTLGELKAHSLESCYTKSWDYARYINLTCLGYAANYITKEEGKRMAAEILLLAQADYKNWDEYYADFVKGRNEWDAEETQEKKDFNELASTITKGENNVYALFPLN